MEAKEVELKKGFEDLKKKISKLKILKPIPTEKGGIGFDVTRDLIKKYKILKVQKGDKEALKFLKESINELRRANK